MVEEAMLRRTRPESFEIQDLGVEHEQYFQGAGVAFTEWDAVYVGTGSTLRDAVEDALEGAAQDAVDTDDVDIEDHFGLEDLDRALPEDAHDEIHHYAALYVRKRDPDNHVDTVRATAPGDVLLYQCNFRHSDNFHYQHMETYDAYTIERRCDAGEWRAVTAEEGFTWGPTFIRYEPTGPSVAPAA